MLDSSNSSKINKALEACQTLTEALMNPHTSPLEREAGYLLGEALLLQISALGLQDDPVVQKFMNVWECSRPAVTVRRFPQDFVAH